MALRIFPTIISGGTGIVRGLARRNDVAQGRANPDGSSMAGRFPLAMAIDVAAFGGGVVLDLMRFTPDITEPLIYSGAAFLGDRGGNAIGGQIGSPSPMRAAVPYYGGNGGAVAQPYAGPVASPALREREKRPVVLG